MKDGAYSLLLTNQQSRYWQCSAVSSLHQTENCPVANIASSAGEESFNFLIISPNTDRILAEVISGPC